MQNTTGLIRKANAIKSLNVIREGLHIVCVFSPDQSESYPVGALKKKNNNEVILIGSML